MDKKPHKLIQSYVLDKYFVSTAYRQCSAMLGSHIWYYETYAWKRDKETKKTGEWIEDISGVSTEKGALDQHFEVCKKLTTGGKD